MEHAHSIKVNERKGDSDIIKAGYNMMAPTNGGQKRNDSPMLLNYMNTAKMNEQQRVGAKLNMFKMSICCALPWALMDNKFSKSFVHSLASNFDIPDHSAFFPKLIAQETAVWETKFKLFLEPEGRYHLTFSLNGWSTSAKDELYTFHMTTPKRRSFFTDGHVFKGISVMGKALADVVTKVTLAFLIFKIQWFIYYNSY